MRYWILALSVFAMALSGCPATCYYQGQLLIVNETGEDMESLILIVDGVHETPLAATAHGQAWIKHAGANDSIGFRWRTRDGEELGVTEPLADHFPRYRGELMVKILAAGSMKMVRCDVPDLTVRQVPP